MGQAQAAINTVAIKLEIGGCKLIEAHAQLIYTFDMHVGGKHFSVPLAGGRWHISSRASFLVTGDCGAETRTLGTNELLDQFAGHVLALN
jgi:hypothetical protein